MLIFNRLTVKHHVDIQSANNDQPLGGLALFGSKLYDTLYIIIHGIQNGLSPCDQLLQPNLHLNLHIYFSDLKDSTSIKHYRNACSG